ncbi:MAG: hypothetical protein WBC62_06010 [Candidatus Macondimonas sp.]
MDPHIAQLLDDLIDHWRFWDQHEEYYLKTLAPSLVENPRNGDATERDLLGELRAVLNNDEWHSIPLLISERRREMRERERLEAQRREDERQEQLRQEADRRNIETRRVELIAEIRRRFNDDYLAVDSFFTASCADLISQQEYEKEKVAFVKDLVASHTPPDKSGIRKTPDDEQAAAIAAVHGHIQVWPVPVAGRPLHWLDVLCSCRSTAPFPLAKCCCLHSTARRPMRYARSFSSP